MKLDKAVEILNDYKMQSAFEATPDFEEAIKLGIEALKRLQRQRSGDLSLIKTPLPGETKE